MRRLLLATVVLAAVSAIPAAAADTTTEFTLTASGGLGVAAPASADLGSAVTTAGTLSAQLGAVTVTDERGVLGSWTASADAGDFTTGGETGDETIGDSQVSYWSGPATGSSGTAVFTPAHPLAVNAVVLDVAKTAFTATAVVGNNSASWNPTLVVSIPSDAVVGTYSGTVTHSVA